MSSNVFGENDDDFLTGVASLRVESQCRLDIRISLNQNEDSLYVFIRTFTQWLEDRSYFIEGVMVKVQFYA